MIHTIHTLTIRQFGELDQTNDLNILRRWWNFLPVKWFDTEKFFEQFKAIFNTSGNNDVSNEAFRIISYSRILMLDRMLKMLSLLMRNTNERSMFSMLFNHNVKEYVGNMPYYIEKIEYLTGIKIKDGNDLSQLQGEIQRLLDKYKQRLPEKKVEENREYRFIDIVFGVFSIMEMAYVPEMKLSEFARLKEMAEKRIKKLEAKNKS